ncbi:MAG: PIN domain-containing protein [Betaproteobacteria bacterium]|nr:PIN domain-containing protein [Betaproteobacteria bacterium]
MWIVADTNTVISGLLWSGPPQQLINAARAKRITLYSSVALTAEFAEVIVRDLFPATGASTYLMVLRFPFSA